MISADESVSKKQVCTVIPAIDLKGGRCVRLRQGRAGDETVYSDDPVSTARRWLAEGAAFLHVVDLDGAFQGRPVHAKQIADIAAAISIPVEVGGGLRTEEDIAAILKTGVARAIIGTRACERQAELAGLAKRFGDRLAVGIDARNGMTQTKGWVETTAVKAVDLARRAVDAGVKTIIYTDTSTDGMLGGVNLTAVREMCMVAGCDIIASGGVSSVADVQALRALNMPNLKGVIVGKAIYDGKVTLGALIAASA